MFHSSGDSGDVRFHISSMLKKPSRDGDYYSRKKVWDPTTGTWSFETDRDIISKREVCEKLTKAGFFDTEDDKADIVETDKYHPIDWYIYGRKTNKPFAVVELKTRSHHSERYQEGTFFNLRKYNALMCAYNDFNLHPYFMVRYTDCVKMVYVPDVDASNIKQNAGCLYYVKSNNDVEDCILLPPKSMTLVYKL